MKKKLLILILPIVTLIFVLTGCVAKPTFKDGLFQVNFLTGQYGSTIESLRGIEVDSLIPRPEDPTRESYSFDGWYVDSQLTTQWNFENDRVTDHVILFAKWVLDQGFTITYFYDEATVENDPRNIAAFAKTQSQFTIFRAKKIDPNDTQTFRFWAIADENGNPILTQTGMMTSISSINPRATEQQKDYYLVAVWYSV